MTDKEVVDAIEAEYTEYKNFWLRQSKESILNEVFCINAMRCLYTFFTGDAHDFEDGTLQKLYELSRGHILSELASEYLNQEWCDIAQYDDILRLIEDYIKIQEQIEEVF